MTAIRDAAQGKTKDHKAHPSGEYSTYKVLTAHGWQMRVKIKNEVFALDQLAKQAHVTRNTIYRRLLAQKSLNELFFSPEQMAQQRLLNLKSPEKTKQKPNGNQRQIQKDNYVRDTCQLAMHHLSKIPTRHQLTRGAKA